MVNSLKKSDVLRSYNRIKGIAEKKFANQEYEECLKLIELLGNIAYNFNFFYKDDVLEELLLKISSKILNHSPKTWDPNNRWVFYDYFGISNRGLTQQYIRALIAWKVEFMYILENPSANSVSILEELKAYSKAETYIVDRNLTYSEKIKQIYNQIVRYKPQNAFLHLHPANVVAVTLWNALSNIKRYQINLTDHAFWLGVNCLDYCLEFRDYGCNVSAEKRGVALDKLRMQPFYPIVDCGPFEGLPEIANDRVVLFTGATYYKMYGENNAFFIIIKRLLDENENCIIFLAGDGDKAPFEKFISENGYSNRLFLLGNRSDINHVFRKCDIFLTTYPITGGLMAQFAAVNSKPILSFSSADIPCNSVESLLTFDRTNQDDKITYDNLEDFLALAKKMINDKNFRNNKGASLKKHVITVPKFEALLYANIHSINQPLKYQKLNIDYERFQNLYIEVENKFLPTYRALILSHFRLSSIFLFPKEILSCHIVRFLIKAARRKIQKR